MPLDNEAPTKPVFFIDDPHAPEIFASFLTGAAFDGPNVRLSFVSSRVNHENSPGTVNNVVNGRVVMSIQSAKQMIVFLQGFLESAALNEISKPPDAHLN